MNATVRYCVIELIVFGSCTSNNDKNQDAGPSGVYVREYAFKVKNPETDRVIGMRTVRDTIFIKPIEGKYEISNHKWMMNDYDQDSWKSMEHADDRPSAIYLADFDQSQLIADGHNVIYFDPEEKRIFSDVAKKVQFNRINR